MPPTDLRRTPPTRPYLREGLLALAFVGLLVLSAFTVLVPELSREPDTAPTAKPAPAPAGQAGAAATAP
jgi:hypothetical protein